LSTTSGRNLYELETATSEPGSKILASSAPIYSPPHRPAPSSSSSSAAAAAVNDPTYNNTTTTLIDNTLYGVQQQIPVTSSNVADNDITLIDMIMIYVVNACCWTSNYVLRYVTFSCCI